ncbi:MAG: RIP metalloprotease RseP [Holosporales bacterium]|jgi:regulator of sigma E protease|nr:RIP metalloprotease RseP [Holosporales bacterium]
MGFIGSVVSLLIVIFVLVVVHEFGHLIIARKNGVFVEAFSVGIGPVVWERVGKNGLKWRISLFPVGGYVKMFGDSDVSSIKEVIPDGYSSEDMDRMSIHRKKPWQKLLVALGGPLLNFIFAIVVLFFFSTINGIPEDGNSISVQNELSLAYTAGLRDGDTIIEANGKRVKTFTDLKDQISVSQGKILKLKVKRGDDQIQDVEIKMYSKNNGEIVPIKILGVTPNLKNIKYKKLNPADGIVFALTTTYNSSVDNITSIFKIATGQMSPKNVGGIISIAKISIASAESGIPNFIWMLAILSIILGSINLLPIPVLDGGTILISAIEWVAGRPLPKKVVEIIFMIGLVLVATLMLLGLWNDLSGYLFK